MIGSGREVWGSGKRLEWGRGREPRLEWGRGREKKLEWDVWTGGERHAMSVMRQVMFTIAVLILASPIASASRGEKTRRFKWCYSEHINRTCFNIRDLTLFHARQPWYEGALGWSCEEVGRYECMWVATEDFIRRGDPVLQFYGKWPFVALLGIQEPVSSAASLLNGATTAAMLVTFRRQVSPTAPMYYLWQGMAVTSINAWIWSTIFHARDVLFTEIMDYFCAYSSVLYLLFVLVARWRIHRPQRRTVMFGAVLVVWYCFHIYLMWPRIHYTYNMVVNVTTGALSSIGWLCWIWSRWRTHPYIWRSGVVVLYTNLLLVLLELHDFPPLFWTFDAHALWHTGTSLMPLLWYRFCIDDCHFLLEKKKRSQLPYHRQTNGFKSSTHRQLDLIKVKVV